MCKVIEYRQINYASNIEKVSKLYLFLLLLDEDTDTDEISDTTSSSSGNV